MPVVTDPLRVLLRLDSARLSRWHGDLLADLAGRGDILPRAELVDTAPAPPGAVGLLATLERLVFRLKGTHAGHPLDRNEVRAFVGQHGQAADVILDLSGGAPPAAGRDATVLRLLFDGAPGDDAALQAALEGRSPRIAVVDGAGRERASGLPAVENTHVLTLALDCIFAAAQALCLKALGRDGLALGEAAGGRPATAVSGRRPGPGAVMRFGARMLRAKLAVRLERLCRADTQWFVAWRRRAADAAPLDLAALDRYRRLPDDAKRYYADPFLFEAEGRTFLFVEDLPFATGCGLISAAELGPDGFGPPRPVLEKGVHLSYPQVFAHEGVIYMVPESCAARTVELYRAERLPDRWVHEATLLSDVPASDATLFSNRDGWWLFATVRQPGGSTWDALHVFFADALRGPWRPHPGNPVTIDSRCARPAGHLFADRGAVWRPAQDCSAGYGAGLALCRIDRLDRERVTQSLHATVRLRDGQVRRGPHTLNRLGGLEVIDLLGTRRALC